jgi:hypothetical protein
MTLPVARTEPPFAVRATVVKCVKEHSCGHDGPGTLCTIAPAYQCHGSFRAA